MELLNLKLKWDLAYEDIDKQEERIDCPCLVRLRDQSQNNSWLW